MGTGLCMCVSGPAGWQTPESREVRLSPLVFSPGPLPPFLSRNSLMVGEMMSDGGDDGEAGRDASPQRVLRADFCLEWFPDGLLLL